MVFSTKKGLLECKPEWNREAITVFSRLPSLRRLQATPPLQTSLQVSQSVFIEKYLKFSLASGSGILTKEDEIECVCKEVRNAARKVGQKSVEENEGTNFGNQHWSLNDFNIGPVISKGCSAVVYAANCLKNGFETIGNDSEGIKEISKVEKI